MKIAFDIDDTLWKLVEDKSVRIEGVGAMCVCGTPLKQEVDRTLIQIVDDFLFCGDQVILWSAGGIEYVKHWIEMHAPSWEDLVQVLPKEKGHQIDICFDDQDVDLATINVRVKREHATHSS